MDKQNWKSAKAKVNITSSMKELEIGESQSKHNIFDERIENRRKPKRI